MGLRTLLAAVSIGAKTRHKKSRWLFSHLYRLITIHTKVSGVRIPLIWVYFCSDPDTKFEKIDEFYWKNADSIWPNGYHCAVINEKLLTCTDGNRECIGSDGWAGDWAFCLPLTILNTSNDLDTQIINPVFRILSKGISDSTFEGADAVLKFVVEGDDYVLQNRQIE